MIKQAADLVGRKVPTVTFPTRVGESWVNLTTDDLFKGKKVVLFALPGAFTPTCSSSHLPRYNALAPVFEKEGVSEIICLSVNDTFVMNAWQKDLNADRIRFVADGNGEFSEGMGMLVEKNDLGFGKRSWRYSMLVNDGVIEKMFIEPEEPGDPFKVSDADTMLNHIAPNAEAPKQISLLSKPGCPHCARAKTTLEVAKMDYEVIELGHSGVSYNSLAAISGQGTTPQIFVNGNRIGGADDLEKWISQQA